MFGRTVWSDDVLAETITDLIHHFNLTSLKTLGTEEGKNHIDLSKKIRDDQEERIKKNETFGMFSLCDSFTE